MDVAGSRAGCGWGRDGPLNWLGVGVGMDHGCGWW